MKTSTKISMIVLAIFLAAQVTNAQQQISFEGMVSQGYGVAAWNADGTGPEPAFTGHQVPFPGFGNLYYYGASRDYITGNPDHSCFAFLPGITGFPNFAQALTANGYTPGQVKAKFGLVTLGDDEEGLDWFVMDNYHHSSHKYSNFNIFELNGEAMLAIKVDYAVWSVQNGTTTYIIDFGYTPLINISGSSSAGVQAVAQAFLEDLDGKSVRLQCESTYGGLTITGNGRNGGYYNIINGTLTVGNPTLPFKGLYADNEGTAGWNADGTGPEPYGNGHGDIVYYSASVDYDGINPSTDACLGHFLEGSAGFFNTLLQLQYRGLEIGNLKAKMGLCSLGPDVEGEDWGWENGIHWINEYNNSFTLELNGEPIIKVMMDTNKMHFINPANLIWKAKSSVGRAYNISQNASENAKFVAKSMLRDIGAHFMIMDTPILKHAGNFSGNGRSGVYYEIQEGYLKAIHTPATFVPPGEVSGIWTAEGSPYYVDGHLEIANGETLTIEPGVKVAVRGPYHFNVQGCVKAEGTEDENIIFTRSNPNLWWDGFDYDATPSTNDTSVFDHCLFEYGKGLGTGDFVHGGSFAIRFYDNIEISNSTFRYNEARTALAAGGAIAMRESSILIQNCTFYNNYSPHAGGAINAAAGSNPIISKCVFYDNYATDYAGAVMAYDNANPVISNNLFFNNHSAKGGALIFYISSNGILINNTIVDNYASIFGGGIYLYSGSKPEVINNIIWNNESVNAGDQVFISGNTCHAGFFYNNIEGGQEGFGANWQAVTYFFNMDSDPVFNEDPNLPPYLIQPGSPCGNAGTPDTSAWYYPQYLPATCLGGNTRTLNGRIDMGAYERLLITDINRTKAPDLAVSVYPNPVKDILFIHFNLSEKASVSAELYSSTGQLLSHSDWGTLQPGAYDKPWSVAFVPEGIYLLMTKINGKITANKIVKSK